VLVDGQPVGQRLTVELFAQRRLQPRTLFEGDRDDRPVERLGESGEV
jgi:hypothetical protein